MEKKEIVFIALMSSKKSVSYLVHTRCIPIRNDIDSLFTKKRKETANVLPKYKARKAKWKMKILIFLANIASMYII